MSMIFLAMLLAQAPQASPVAATPAEQPAAVKKQKSKEVCKSILLTGSRFPQRVCHTVDSNGNMEQDVTDAMYGLGKIGKISDPAVALPGGGK